MGRVVGYAKGGWGVRDGRVLLEIVLKMEVMIRLKDFIE